MSENSKGGLGALFFYIGVGIALLFSVVSGIQAAFGVIDRLIFSDDIAWYQVYHSADMPMSAAFLLVSFIVLVAVARKTRGVVHEYQGTIWHTLCRTIIFIILTASVALSAVALSIFFGDVFSGSISLNSFLKSMFVAGVGFAIFYYYRGVLRGAWRAQKKEERVFVATIGLLVGLLIIGTVIIFNPFKQPALQVTYEKLECLGDISVLLEDVYFDEKKNGLPATESYAQFLESEVPSHHRAHDWECRDAGISYELVDTTQYRLCASFAILPEGTVVKHYPYRAFEVREVGENCFDMDVEK